MYCRDIFWRIISENATDPVLLTHHGLTDILLQQYEDGGTPNTTAKGTIARLKRELHTVKSEKDDLQFRLEQV